MDATHFRTIKFNLLMSNKLVRASQVMLFIPLVLIRDLHENCCLDTSEDNFEMLRKIISISRRVKESLGFNQHLSF